MKRSLVAIMMIVCCFGLISVAPAFAEAPNPPPFLGDDGHVYVPKTTVEAGSLSPDQLMLIKYEITNDHWKGGEMGTATRHDMECFVSPEPIPEGLWYHPMQKKGEKRVHLKIEKAFPDFMFEDYNFLSEKEVIFKAVPYKEIPFYQQ